MDKVWGPDGLQLSVAEDQRLNALVLATFGKGGGREVLHWLRSVTIEMVGGPEISDAQLRHREGARYLVAVIENRLKQGEAHARGDPDTPRRTRNSRAARLAAREVLDPGGS
jgi:hypothetical protein